MATFFSNEWTTAHITTPPGVNYQWGLHGAYRFTYTHVGSGTAGDLIKLFKIPPKTTIDMYCSYFQFSGWTSGATLSVGWEIYIDEDGASQAADAAGLLSAVSLTADGAWSHGMLVVATPDDSNPVGTGVKIFNNRDEVTIYATIGTQAPAAGDILNGRIQTYT